MSQCVPSWELDDNHVTVRRSLRSNSNSTAPPDVPMSEKYEVAELTWENGQLAMHGLGPTRVPPKPLNSTTNNWDKPRWAGGTLESIVNQATRFPQYRGEELVPWLDHHRAVAAASAASSATMAMDALVPCSNNKSDREDRTTTHVIGCSTRVGSCSGPAGTQDVDEVRARGGAARVPVTPPEWSTAKEQQQQSPSGCSSATFGKDHSGGGGHHPPLTTSVDNDTYDKDYMGMGFTYTTSLGSPENTNTNTSSATPRPKPKPTTTDDHDHDHDSVCHSRPQRVACDEEDKKKENGKASVSTKRSRAAAIHNQSERKRRDKINQRMKTLQKLVPNSSKTDKASMLDEVIEYLKQLQAQVSMMNRMNMAPMMLPMTMQQQMQLSMMASQMGMGMGMGMGMAGMGVNVMDMNTMGRPPNITGISPVLPNPFMIMASWDGSGDHRLQQAAASAVMPDPISTFLACQSQPMTMEAYSRMAAMYQQMQQPPASSSKG